MKVFLICWMKQKFKVWKTEPCYVTSNTSYWELLVLSVNSYCSPQASFSNQLFCFWDQVSNFHKLLCTVRAQWLGSAMVGYLYFIHYWMDRPALHSVILSSNQATWYTLMLPPYLPATALSLNAVVIRNLPKVPQTKQHPTGNLQFH